MLEAFAKLITWIIPVIALAAIFLPQTIRILRDVEVKDVVLPDSMKRAIASQAESKRERRAKIINAEAEFQAAEKLVQAASMISAQPIALQLRFLHTIKEISSEPTARTSMAIRID